MSNYIGDNVKFINDDLDSVKAFTPSLLIGFITLLKQCGICIYVYKNVLSSTTNQYVLSYCGVYTSFKNIKELVYYLKPIYDRCKLKQENDYYKKVIKEVLDEKEL